MTTRWIWRKALEGRFATICRRLLKLTPRRRGEVLQLAVLCSWRGVVALMRLEAEEAAAVVEARGT